MFAYKPKMEFCNRFLFIDSLLTFAVLLVGVMLVFECPA